MGRDDKKDPVPSADGGKRCYTAEEIQEILRISRPTLYKLLKERVFSWVRLSGGQYRISKKSFDEWLDSGDG